MAKAKRSRGRRQDYRLLERIDEAMRWSCRASDYPWKISIGLKRCSSPHLHVAPDALDAAPANSTFADEYDLPHLPSRSFASQP
jgi:hypothetical protein